MNFDYTQVDFFDGLPDHVLVLVFNKVHDVKALSFAMCVSKRFRSIIPEVDSVFLSIPSQNVLGNSLKRSREDKSLLKNLLSRVIVKPLNFLLGFLKSQKGSSFSSSSRDIDMESSCFLPHEVLKPFKSLRKLEIKLPKSDFEMKGSNLLKWKAEFGSQIKSCVLVGATSISNINCEEEEEEEQLQETDQVGNQDLRDVSEDGFKMRIIWSLSCLIAASARHVLVKKTLKRHEMVEHLEIRDEGNQGLVSMNKEQIQELKKSMISGGENEEGFLLEKTKVPGLRMKMWYVPVLKLPGSGTVMKGATLVIIKPVVGWKKAAEEECDGSWVAEVFDDGEGEEGKVFEEAVKELMKKEKSCTLEMNSF